MRRCLTELVGRGRAGCCGVIAAVALSSPASAVALDSAAGNTAEVSVKSDSAIRDRGSTIGDTMLPMVRVRIRMIRATPRRAGEPERKKLKLDPQIADLESKLRDLHFKNFKLVGNEELSIPVKKRETVVLAEGNVLYLRPLYLENNRVGMWIKWIDQDGTQVLLDSRMHFCPSESMITGTDGISDSGLILAINAAAAEPRTMAVATAAPNAIAPLAEHGAGLPKIPPQVVSFSPHEGLRR